MRHTNPPETCEACPTPIALTTRIEAARDAVLARIDSVLVDHFPEVQTGDVSFDDPFNEQLRDFLTRWYSNNCPVCASAPDTCPEHAARCAFCNVQHSPRMHDEATR